MNRELIIEVLQFLDTKKYEVKTNKNLKREIITWLKTLDVTKIDFNKEDIHIRLALGYFKQKGFTYMMQLLKREGYEDIESFHKYIGALDAEPYIENMPTHNEAYEAIIIDFLEEHRVNNRKGFNKVLLEKQELPKRTVYNDIDKEKDTAYESKKMGMITTNNVNLGKVYVYFDTFFTLNTKSHFVMNISNKEQYVFNSKSIPSNLVNVKSFKISEIFIPMPSNILLTTDDIIKLNFDETALLSHREYPNVNYMFQCKVEVFGSRLKLIPLNDYFQLSSYLSILYSLTASFWLQHKILEFNVAPLVANLTSGVTTNFNTVGHGLNTGDKIAMYDFFIIEFSSVFVVTVTGPNDFNIDIDSTAMVLPASAKYYVLKNKIEFNLDITCL